MRALQIHGAKDLRLVELSPPHLAPDEARVAIRTGGICGSDLSYYFKGKVGDFALKEPMILGHEVAGEIVEIGEGVQNLTIGDQVAVNPSRPCRACAYCLAGEEQSLPRHAVFRKRCAHAACSRRLQRCRRGARRSVPYRIKGDACSRRRGGGAPRRRSACGAASGRPPGTTRRHRRCGARSAC